MSSMNTNERIVPLLPLRGVLVYPTMVLHLDVGRDKSIQALEQAAMDENIIFLAMQKEMNIDDPKEDDIYSVGTVAKVKQMLKLPNGTLRVLVEGLHRAEVVEFIEEENVVQVSIKTVTEEVEADLEEKALMRTLLEHFEQYIKVSKKVSNETFATVADVEEPGRLVDLIASHLPIKTKQKQEILEIISVKERLHTLISIIQDEQELLSLEKKIGQKVKRSMERTQKRIFLA
ncbi:ATP-dependent protease La 1 [Bacillus anthracis str. CDC 684]|nr:ATP-dependent protease La 1 [Bacillus anthracis str. CDC 684]